MNDAKGNANARTGDASRKGAMGTGNAGHFHHSPKRAHEGITEALDDERTDVESPVMGRAPEADLTTAFVLGGGGVLGASEVGMLQALLECNVHPDLIVGTSVGALNGAFIAADPTEAAVEGLRQGWVTLTASEVFSGSLLSRVVSLARHGTHLHDNEALRSFLDEALGGRAIEELVVRFECVAASIERAEAHWFSQGPVVDAVLASCSVPGLLPPFRIGAEHFFDGGLVHSIPVSRAVASGAKRIYVLHVGRIEQPLSVPTKPWEVALVSFEIARRHRFAEEMAALPPDVELHLLPTGAANTALANLRYRDTSRVERRIQTAYEATHRYLSEHEQRR